MSATTEKRDPRHDPQPGDVIRMDGDLYTVTKREGKDGYFVESRGPVRPGPDGGMRTCALGMWQMAMAGAEVVHVAGESA